jgi:hypothetical protein
LFRVVDATADAAVGAEGVAGVFDWLSTPETARFATRGARS